MPNRLCVEPDLTPVKEAILLRLPTKAPKIEHVSSFLIFLIKTRGKPYKVLCQKFSVV